MFKHQIVTEIAIEASAERVWTTLLDFAAYPSWNPFVVAIAGDATPGARLDVRLQQPGGSALRLRPTVQHLEPGRHFAWRGRLGLPGLFDGEHGFTVEGDASGGVRFVHEELFTGLLVPALRGLLETRTREGFERMNRALKDRVEQSPT